MTSAPTKGALPKSVTSSKPILDTSSERGSLVMYLPKPNILVTRAVGHLDHTMAQAWLDLSDRLFAGPGPLAVFNEWSEMQSYDSRSRQLLTKWVLDHRADMTGAWFLTGSRIVAMGVAVAGSATALAGVHLYASRSRTDWEATLREMLRG